MPDQYANADALREYLTGALSDGAPQDSPAASLGGWRSPTEAASLGIAVLGPVPGTRVLFAGAANQPGTGLLTAVDASTLTWQAPGAAGPGSPVPFPAGTTVKVVESVGDPGRHLRVEGTPPFAPGQCRVTLAYLYDNYFGFPDVAAADAAAGLSQYRASLLRNESPGAVTALQRWLAPLAPAAPTDAGFLGPSGAGAVASYAPGAFDAWPESGWCQVRSAGGALKEVVYYTSRTATALSVPAAGRGLLGTAGVLGGITDQVVATPGVALGLDPAGVLAFGNGIQQVATPLTPPAGVSWVLGITPAAGLQIGTLPPGTQAGLWLWRQLPAGAVPTPAALTLLRDSFNAF